MRRFVSLAALLVLLIGGLPVHAQEADTSATDTAVADTTAADPSETAASTDTTQADTVQTVRADRAATSPSAAGSSTEGAQAAAESWLALIDDGEFGESWDAAAPSLREGGTREQWIARGTQARQQLQALQSRELRSAQYRDSTAQLPGGPVAILQYLSEFDGGSTLEAVITTQRDSTWAVAGYRVVPAPSSVIATDSVTAGDSTEVPSDTTEADTSPE